MVTARGGWMGWDSRAAGNEVVSRQARLRRERKAQRVPVWDEGGVDEHSGRTLAPRWRLVHPEPYGGHGSTTAASVCKCQCRACLHAAAVYARTRYASRAAWRAQQRTGS